MGTLNRKQNGAVGAAKRQLAILFPALLAATLALACTSDDEPPRTDSFYAEVTIEVEPAPDDPIARFGIAEGRSVIRWWYAPDPVRWRWEIETVGTIIDDGVALTVVNGDDSWEYDDRTNTYRRGIIGGIPAGVVLPLTFSAPVGPANAETIDALIEQWRERGDDPEVGLAGEATLLGRRTQIVELRPSTGGVVRMFVDPERMFILRWAVDGTGGGQSYRAEVTALDYDTKIDASRFTFDPPPGAREAEARSVQSCSSTRRPCRRSVLPRRTRLPQTRVHVGPLPLHRGRLRGQRERWLRSDRRLGLARSPRRRLHPAPPAPPSRRRPPGGAFLATCRLEP